MNPRLIDKKTDMLPQRLAEKTSKNSEEKHDSAEPKTPLTSSSHDVRANSKVPTTTPFYTAMHCSKCRFDRLETSSYWVGQIKMAESVGKHFVASDFFRLALESQAEVFFLSFFPIKLCSCFPPRLRQCPIRWL